MVNKLEKGILVRLRTNIQHKTEFRLKILANRLEEPLVRINLSIVSVLDSKHNVEPSAFEVVILIKTNIPSCHLEQMKQVLWPIFLGCILSHKCLYFFHLVIVVFLLHEAALD